MGELGEAIEIELELRVVIGEVFAEVSGGCGS